MKVAKNRRFLPLYIEGCFYNEDKKTVLMEQTYLSGTLQERIIDLLKEKSMTQQQLANLTGMTVGTLSRFLSGKIDKLSADNVISITQKLQVSTNFLLGKVTSRGALTTISANWGFLSRQPGICI